MHLERYKNDVNEKPRKVNGVANNRYSPARDTFLLSSFHKGCHILLCMEWDTFTHVILTSDTDWDPSVLDSTEFEDDAWFDTVLDESKLESHGPFEIQGDYVERTIVQDTEI